MRQPDVGRHRAAVAVAGQEGAVGIDLEVPAQVADQLQHDGVLGLGVAVLTGESGVPVRGGQDVTVLRRLRPPLGDHVGRLLVAGVQGD